MTPTPRDRASDLFRSVHGTQPVRHVQAPGRVNLIGEHTDYNGGFVLPVAIDRGTAIAAAARSDAVFRVSSADYGGAVDEFHLDAPITRSAVAPWADYVRGVVQQLLAAGYTFGGADIALAGNVPQGAGLSSSASLEVAIAQAVKTLYQLEALTPTDMALIAQRAENQFVGCNCGIMDQLISARGQAGHALLIDCRSLEATPVRLPEGVAVVIIESRVQRGLVGSEYNLRRQQCESVARHFGVAALRDVDLPTLVAQEGRIDSVALRRARHVITENDRTRAAAEVLQRGDLRQMGELMAESHVSMRDDFEITVPAIDGLVSLVQGVVGADGGARMTGGGFGGCVVAVVPEDRVTDVTKAVAAKYVAPNGEAGVVHVCRSADGAGALN